MFASSPGLAGMVVWGRAETEDVDDLLYLFDRPQPSSMATSGDVLVDLSRVEGAGPEVFERLLEGSLRRMDVLRARIRRQVVVRPSGMIGAVAEGFSAFIHPDYIWQVVQDLHTGLALLQPEDSDGLAAEIQLLVDQATSGSPLVARLHAWLLPRCAAATIEEAAVALAMSTRTLQRRLGEEGSSFGNELSSARIRRAQQLLVDSQRKIEAIASEIGCATPSAFTTLFKRYCDGLTPSEYRDKHARPDKAARPARPT